MNRTPLKVIVCNVWISPFLDSNDPNCLGNITFVFRQGWRSNTPCVHPPLLYWLRLKRPIIHCSGLLQLPPLPSDWSSQRLFFAQQSRAEYGMSGRGWISAGRGKYLDKKNDCWHLRTFRHLVSVMSGQKHKNTNKQTESLIFGCQGSFAFLQRFLFASSWGLAQRLWLHTINWLVI